MSGLCPVLSSDQQDIITSENMQTLALSTYERTEGTVVDVTCYVDTIYRLQGASTLTCRNGSWVPEIPTCVRKDGLAPDGSNLDEILNNRGDSDDQSDTYSILLIVISSTCAVFILAIIIVVIYKLFEQRQSKFNREMKFDRLEKSGSGFRGLPRARLKRNSTAPWNTGTNLSPSPANNASQDRESGASVREGGRTPIIQSAWPPGGTTRGWNYLSVDRLLRDIEISRRENPDHSWRDFATLSSPSHHV